MISPRAFIAGFLTVATLLLLLTCSQNDSGTNPDPDPGINVDVIHQGAKKVEDAFRSADPAAVLAVMTEEAKMQYGSELEGIKARMPEFADAIASRQLTAYSAGYAEYQYTAGSRTLSFALAAQDDGDWKLMRF
ncbi:MAG: hypothetical protein WC824_02090 [Bacteroidota bacterium]|jgi:hypothetical protein